MKKMELIPIPAKPCIHFYKCNYYKSDKQPDYKKMYEDLKAHYLKLMKAQIEKEGKQ